MSCSGFSVYLRRVRLNKIRLVPLLLALGAILVVCFVQSMRIWRKDATGVERMELITYDWRAQHALQFDPPVATNLAFLGITDRTIKAIQNQEVNLGQSYGLYWPRHIYGRLVRELNAQGVRAIAYDVIFADLRPDLAPFLTNVTVTNAEGQAETFLQQIDSDAFFADEMHKYGNVFIASTPGLIAHDVFMLSANAIGDISAVPDSDGALRRASPFQRFRFWHQNIKEMVGDKAGMLLHQADAHERFIIFRNSQQSFTLPLTNGVFDLLKLTAEFLPEYTNDITEEIRWQVPYQDIRVWHMGILMAAKELGLDLNRAEMREDSLHIPGTNGVDRTIPLDHNGYFNIDWSIPVSHEGLLVDQVEWQILNDTDREAGQLPPPEELEKFKDKLVFIGSAATGNELTDRGATPLGFEEFLVSKHWNVANMFIVNRFIERSRLPAEIGFIMLLGVFAGLVTFFTKPPWSTVLMIIAGGVYSWWCVDRYVTDRLWLPIVAPVGGGLFFTHFTVMIYQLIFENQERQRIKGVFSKLVSPNVVNELLQQSEVHLGGSRRRITVFFSDVRGFTTMTDEMQKYADDYIAEHKLEGDEAEQFRDQVAADTLETVNTYLATIADQIKKHDGTLDKYIGDCVMAFWGAPTPNEQHAVACVKSTIDAQLAMHELNIVRGRENVEIELENERRAARGEPPLPLKRLLVMGSGVNTGMAIVGLMGSEAHIFNFTVFGREVNLASRLEHVSGRSRIIVGETTFRDLQQFAPEIAETCLEQDPVRVKGIEGDVRIWEVPWRIYLPEGDGTQRLERPQPVRQDSPGDKPAGSDNTSSAA